MCRNRPGAPQRSKTGKGVVKGSQNGRGPPSFADATRDAEMQETAHGHSKRRLSGLYNAACRSSFVAYQARIVQEARKRQKD